MLTDADEALQRGAGHCEARRGENLRAKGMTVVQSCKRLGASDQPFFRWRVRYGALKENEAQRLKALEQRTHGSRRSSPSRPFTS